MLADHQLNKSAGSISFILTLKRQHIFKMLFLLLGIALAFFVAIYLFFSWNNDYWKKRGIPFEEPSFFFGNFKEVLAGKIHFGLPYCNLYKKFDNAAYFGFFKLHIPTVVVRDLDLIKDVLVKDFNNFARNDFHIEPEQDAILAENPFLRSGEEWRLRRAQWSSGMTMSRIKLMFPAMLDKCDMMTRYLNNHSKETPEEPLEARELALKYLTDVIVSSVLGLQVNTFEDDQNAFKRIASTIFTSDFWEGMLNLVFTIAPWVYSIFNIGFLKKETERDLKNIAKNIIAIRKEHGFLQNDFFEAMLKHENVNESQIAGRVFGFLSEGIETSSGLIAYMLFELASNPHVQTKLREELEEAAEANGGKLTFENIHGMQYLDMVVLETLRTYPPVLTLNKQCTKVFTLPPAVPGAQPFEVPVGMIVTIPNYATQMDPQYFENPEVFDPERFAEETKDNIPKFAFMPFGEGPRICVGMRLGLTNAKTCVSTIIRNFELRVAARTKPKPLPIDPNVFVTRAVGNIWLTFHKISK